MSDGSRTYRCFVPWECREALNRVTRRKLHNSGRCRGGGARLPIWKKKDANGDCKGLQVDVSAAIATGLCLSDLYVVCC